MKILVIGGTRYMGRIMVQNLLDQGDEVTIFSRGNTQPEWWDQVGHIQGDRNDRDDFNAKLKGAPFDAVVDTQAYRWEDVESAIGTFEGSVGRYLFVSTGSVYLDGKLDFFTHSPFKEDDVNWDTLDYTYPDGEDPYGVGKRHCEKWLNENSRIPYTIVRIPADGAVNFIRALKSPNTVNQTYHIAMQEVMTIERWADPLWKAAGHESAVSFVPTKVIRKTLERYSPPLSRALPYIHDLSKAERDFGFTTTPVEEWIQTTVDWYRDNQPENDSAGYQRRGDEVALATRWAGIIENAISAI